MATLPLIPAQSSTFTRVYRKREMRLGDGYSQRVPDGINATEWTATLNFENLSQTDFSTLLTFMDSIGSWGYFTYITPDGNTTKFSIIQDQTSITALAALIWTVSVQARQEWDIGS